MKKSDVIFLSREFRHRFGTQHDAMPDVWSVEARVSEIPGKHHDLNIRLPEITHFKSENTAQGVRTAFFRHKTPQ